MKPATWPRDDVGRERLMTVDAATGALADHALAELPSLLRAGDVLVVNDAATLPASLHGTTRAGAPIEIRLWQRVAGPRFEALLFGAGDWRARTEDRRLPPILSVGDDLSFSHNLSPPLVARIGKVGRTSARLLTIEFDRDGIDLFRALYVAGSPIQYSYVERPYALWHVQTRFAAVPVAAEMPSAGRPLSWATLLEVRRRGVSIVPLTHAAGLSSTGDLAIDALLPLPERWSIPAATARAVSDAQRDGRRVIAVGTTVVRALESAADARGAVREGEGVTDLVITPSRPMRVVSGLLTGVHGPEESHYALLSALAPRALLENAIRQAEQLGYVTHEMGDSMLIVSGDTPRPATH